ncbi:MAG: heme NO-binding domain-containing protein [Pseudomonadota bacterium]
MQGVVFTELFEFVEDRRSPLFLQEVVDAADLATGGVYCAAGVYDDDDFGRFVSAYCRETGDETSVLYPTFGTFMARRFFDAHPEFLNTAGTAFDFLARVETDVRPAAAQLYPEGDIPDFCLIDATPKSVRFVVKCAPGLEDFCQGVLAGVLAAFEETAEVARRSIASKPVSIIEFTVERASA